MKLIKDPFAIALSIVFAVMIVAALDSLSTNYTGWNLAFTFSIAVLYFVGLARRWFTLEHESGPGR
ncbi:hypothetical protein DVS77_21490 [Mycolicibacterium moriokaense]|nr:hypothetical protein DVS77_21490 [Mycolicibacterium moriokaense]